MRVQDKDNGQVQASGLNDTPKKNRFYAFCSMGEQETSPDVVTGILKVFSIDVYVLLASGANVSFVTPLVAKSLTVCSIICLNLL